jgi:hypothetical protein
MPKHAFHLRIDAWNEIHALPDCWPTGKLREVLALADFDDAVSDEEVPEMVVMVLQDLELQQAGERVLEVVFGDSMKSGVRQNVVDDLQDDRPWEHFADVDKQAGLFEAVVLLQRAFPERFGIPDALRVRIGVRASDAETSRWLREGASSALLLRLLASGMGDDAVLKRLYASELASDDFRDADAILWRVEELEAAAGDDPASRLYELYSSWQWLGPLEDRGPWQGVGWPDRTRSTDGQGR